MYGINFVSNRRCETILFKVNKLSNETTRETYVLLMKENLQLTEFFEEVSGKSEDLVIR